MSYPYARSYDEAYLYMELRPCVCGETDFDKTTASSFEDGSPVTRYAGQCPNCGRDRRFTFRMPDGPAEISFDMRYGRGDEPSHVIDPGEWLGVADLFEANARAELGSGDIGGDDQLTAIFYLLSGALAATEEVVKFLPPGARRVPEDAFRSQAGRMLFELTPDRFTRVELERTRAEREAALAEFDRVYGPAEEQEVN
jgi:hypothetical protein